MSDSVVPENRVDVFFIGVGKCGTSWIHRYFVGRGDVGVPTIKEPYILEHPLEKQLAMIERLWDDTHPRCDFSNLYYWDEQSAERILAHNPQAKIVLTVRLPSKRVASHFAFLQRNGENTETDVISFLNAGDPDQLVERSDYATVLSRFEEHFPASQLLVMPLELLAANPQAYVDRLNTFIGLSLEALGADEAKKVLGRSKARSPRLSRLAKRTSERLRESGRLEMLSVLKESKFVRRALFSEIDGPAEEIAEWPTSVRELDDAYPAFLEAAGLSPKMMAKPNAD